MGSRFTYSIVDADGVPHAECTARDVLTALENAPEGGCPGENGRG